ncbi:hypothetical protein KOI40_11980 [Aestuariicella sp. G3-2]|uniref:hypothetical protein n=1 Tax=Pseudomaricurvus albidus TaxID=2842452 RepID=UPI001C0DC0B7|nr:hypothetical protein [Aestuariicella albida]MBU3070543.1 hypothetical protein [Aestuariicella albida]
MSREEELYTHFQECLASLNRAWAILSDLESQPLPPSLATAAINMALIEYAKPFKDSGVQQKRHSLGLPLASEEDHLLHRYLLEQRDNVLSHSTTTLENSQYYAGKDGGFRSPLMAQGAAHRLPPLSEIQSLIERVLDVFYAQLPQLEKQL